MSQISSIKGREIIDSRGHPTIEVEVTLDCGVVSRAGVPSGASTGVNEALELRDGDEKRYYGKGVLKAAKNINQKIAKSLLNVDVLNQKVIDYKLLKLDGTENKTNLGANAMLGVSLACAKAAAEYLELPLYRYLSGPFCDTLPIPMANILNGGSHSSSNVDIQEFMIIPQNVRGIQEAVQAISEVFQTLKGILKKSGYATAVGDEGGFAPNVKSNEMAIELILEAIVKSGYKEKDMSLALDVAASEMMNHSSKKGKYCFWKSSKKELSSDEMIKYWQILLKKYPQIISLEDPLGETDWKGWGNLSREFQNKKVQLVGDDLFVTNKKYLERGIKSKIANAILIKLNQIGTLTETFEVIELAKSRNYATIISHRSGETEDTFIADLAVGSRASQIKTGSMSRSERVAKYNQLLRIEEELGGLGVYSKDFSFRNLT